MEANDQRKIGKKTVNRKTKTTGSVQFHQLRGVEEQFIPEINKNQAYISGSVQNKYKLKENTANKVIN